MNKTCIGISIFTVFNIILFYITSDIYLSFKDKIIFDNSDISHWSNLSVILNLSLTYISIITLATTAIIMIINNKELKKQYNEQNKKQEDKNFISDITLLISTINDIIKNNQFQTSDNRKLDIKPYLNGMRQRIIRDFDEQEVNSSDVLLEHTIEYYKHNDIEIFHGVSQLFFVLLNSINQIDKSQKIHQMAKSMVIGYFDNELRFLIACYMYSKIHQPDMAEEIRKFGSFYEIPDYCEKLVTPSESEEKAMDTYRNGELS